ncbi:inner-membrane translocator [Parafrankia sp. EAN1pec]|uniref:ABC transporter permease n=1 Tax=Parafrankia sp. (strain EAN1pec) TaxID=298653 RepID=UPI0000540283|nr:inner-membrane translocator [Frankia sp. EAN1pec]
MTDFLLYVLLGLGPGAVYAALGLGVVLTYRSSGTINLAYGAAALYPAYVFAQLNKTGELILPIPGVPPIYFGGVPSKAVALVVALLVAALLGVLIHLLVFRPLATEPALARVVASIGVLITIQAIVIIRFDEQALQPVGLLPDDAVNLGDITVPADRLLLGLLVVLVCAVLAAVYRFTSFGLASRAAATNPKGATLLGYSTDSLALVNSTIAAVLAGLFGILVAPITSLQPTTLTLLIVPALAAALIGRFTSFGVTVAAALVVGILQSQIVLLQGKLEWLPRAGLGDALPFAVIVIAMFAVGARLPGRGAASNERMPTAPPPRHRWSVGLPAVAVGCAIVYVLSDAYLGSYVTSLIAGLVCLSFVVLTGYTGQVSLAQMAIAGVSAFGLSKFAHGIGIPFPLAPLLAIGGAVLGALAVGIPALRVRGVHLAVVTIALAVAVASAVFGNPAVTGGTSGSPVPTLSIFGFDFRGGETGFAVVTVLVLAVAGFAVANLRLSPVGLQMLAVRANERAAASVGINVARMKLLAFAFSGVLSGTAGVMLAYNQSNVSFQSFGAIASLSFLAVAYLGGITTISGAVVGGMLVNGGLMTLALQNWFEIGSYQLLVSGVGLIVTAVLNPQGISGATQQSAAKLLAAIRRRGHPSPSELGKPPAVPSGVAS